MMIPQKEDAPDVAWSQETLGPIGRPQARMEREEEQKRGREEERDQWERMDKEQRERRREAGKVGQNHDREQQHRRQERQVQDWGGAQDAEHLRILDSQSSTGRDNTNAKGGFLRPPSFKRRPPHSTIANWRVTPDASETDSSTDPSDVVPLSFQPAVYQRSQGDGSVDDETPPSFQAPPRAGPQIWKPQYSEEDIILTRHPSPGSVKPRTQNTDGASSVSTPPDHDAILHDLETPPLVPLSNTWKHATQSSSLLRGRSSATRPASAQKQPSFPTDFSEGLYQLHGYSTTSLQSTTHGTSSSPSRPAPQIWKPISTQHHDVVHPRYPATGLRRLGSTLGSTTNLTSTSAAGYYSSATDSSSERSDNGAMRGGQGRSKVPRNMPPVSFKPLPPLPTLVTEKDKNGNRKSPDSEQNLSHRSAPSSSATGPPHRPAEAQSPPPLITVQDYENLPFMSYNLRERHRPAEVRAFGDIPPAKDEVSFIKDAPERLYHPSPSVRSKETAEGLFPYHLNAALKELPQPPLIPNNAEDRPPMRPYPITTTGFVSRRTSPDALPRSHPWLADHVSPSASHGEAPNSDTSSPASEQKFTKQNVSVQRQEPNTAGVGQIPPLSNPATGSNVRPNSRRLALDKLSAIFDNRALYRSLLSSNSSDAQIILDVFQMLLDTRELHDRRRRQLITAMRRLSAKTRLYPRRFNLTGPVHVLSDHPVTSGSYADIYRAYSHGEDLCLKVIKAYKPSLVEHMAKVYAKEAILWGQLSHPNVLPFYGLFPFHTQISFVSPWAEKGHLGDYLEQNPRANRVLLCLDTAAGIAYLHANTIVHGDLKAANVLVDDSGRACLADFGLSSVTDPEILHWATQSSVASRGGSIRWQAPELHVPAPNDAAEDKIIHNSKETDVFAWACLCYEIFTGHLPFFETRNEATVMLKVILGARPTRPPAATDAWVERGLTTHMWALMDDCWKFKPLERPDISSVLSRLQIEKPVDHRAPAQWQGKSAMRFRNSHDASVRQHQHRPSLRDLDSILSRVTLSS